MIEVIQNITLLSLCFAGIYAVTILRPPPRPWWESGLLFGAVLGAVAFLTTITPLMLPGGATIDARAGPVLLAGLLGGPLGGLIAALAGSAARILVGGTFAFSAVVVFFVYAGFGIALGAFRRRHRGETAMDMTDVQILAALGILGAASAWFLIEPRDLANQWIRVSFPIIAVMNIISTVAAGVAAFYALRFGLRQARYTATAEKLELARQSLPIGLWDLDIASGKMNLDKTLLGLYGEPPRDLVTEVEFLREFIHADDAARAIGAFETAMNFHDTYENEFRIHRTDGAIRWIRSSAVIQRHPDGTAYRAAGLNIDITDLRESQEREREAQGIAFQSQKMEAIGKLTGGVAHDFNNLLSVVLGNLELLQDELKKPAPDTAAMGADVEDAMNATLRGGDLTRSMLAFARQARLEPVPLDLNDIVRQVQSWARRTMPAAIDMQTSLEAGLWIVEADRSSTESALLNLLINARDAMDGAGKLTVETANMRVEEEYIEARGEVIEPGRYVMLAVSDTGSGIGPEALERIFEPFWSTKNPSMSSGLGLSMVEGFMRQSGGLVRVYSEPGVGTTFKLMFPAGAEIRVRETQPEEVARGAREGARILLVEDEPSVLRLMQRTLENAGHVVIPAGSGDTAAEIFEADPEAIDIVVSDIVMPGTLQGPALGRLVRKARPDMAMVFVSGYAAEAAVHGNGLSPRDIRLTKPVQGTVLVNAVETALSRSGWPGSS